MVGSLRSESVLENVAGAHRKLPFEDQLFTTPVYKRNYNRSMIPCHTLNRPNANQEVTLSVFEQKRVEGFDRSETQYEQTDFRAPELQCYDTKLWSFTQPVESSSKNPSFLWYDKKPQSSRVSDPSNLISIINSKKKDQKRTTEHPLMKMAQ